MNKDKTRKAIKVMQAYVDGADVEYNSKQSDSWNTCMTTPSWAWNEQPYRVKPAKPRTGAVSVSFNERFQAVEATPEVCEALKKAGISYD